MRAKFLQSKNIVAKASVAALAACCAVALAMGLTAGASHDAQGKTLILSNGTHVVMVTAMGICGDQATWSYSAENSTLYINGTGDMYDYNGTATTPWARYTDSITTIEVSSGVTSIGAGAFWCMPNLASVTLPEGLTAIGDNAMGMDSELVSIALPSTLAKVGEGAFCYDEKLASFSIADGCSAYSTDGRALYSATKHLVAYAQASGNGNMTYEVADGTVAIDKWAFAEDELSSGSLTGVTLPDSLTTIDEWAFGGCTALKFITVPAQVTSIGSYAFAHCQTLHMATIQGKITAIPENTFLDCTSLTTVYLPKSVTTIGKDAFADCEKLAAVNYSGTQTDRDGIDFTEGNHFITDETCVWFYEVSPSTVKKFPDVRNASEWYYDSVYQAASTGLVSGYGNGNFGPNDTLTRAQAAVILWRYYTGGTSEKEDNLTGMPDVNDKDWYTAAANWAVNNKVISGKGKGADRRFDPTGTITREQLCTIIANASASFMSSEISGGEDKVKGYPDQASISDWAYTSVAWSVDKGVISGKKNNATGLRYIDPSGNVTRAEMAAIVVNSIYGNLL